MKSNRASSAMGGGGKKSKSKSKGKKKHVHEMHIRHSANGGYIAKHVPPPGADQMQGPEEHTLPDMDSLASHVQDNMASPPPAQGMPMAMPQQQPRGGM